MDSGQQVEGLFESFLRNSAGRLRRKSLERVGDIIGRKMKKGGTDKSSGSEEDKDHEDKYATRVGGGEERGGEKEGG